MGYNYIDKIRDGKITLLTRGGSPIIYCRFRVQGKKDYLYRTTQTISLEQAKIVAADLYDEIRFRLRNNLTINNFPFQKIYNEWYQANSAYLSPDRKRYIEGTANRYLIPFFKEIKANELNDRKVEEYWSWRVNYWVTGPGVIKIEEAKNTRVSRNKNYKNKKGNVAKKPAQQTLRMEQSLLRSILSWANRFGYINAIPLIKAPQIQPTHITNRRPAFTQEEWEKLYTFMRKWANEGITSFEGQGENGKFEKGRQKGVPRVTKFHRYQRQLLRNYVLFLCNTGLRIGEARQLRWGDIENFIDNGEEHIAIKVRATTKTGAREVVAMPGTARFLERIKENSNHTNEDDLVFCNSRGKAIDNFGKTFKKLLDLAGLLEDNEGKVRTLYSLRHTYATLRILKGEVNYPDLAQNMGTSISNIEKHYSHVTVRQRAGVLTGFRGRSKQAPE